MQVFASQQAPPPSQMIRSRCGSPARRKKEKFVAAGTSICPCGVSTGTGPPEQLGVLSTPRSSSKGAEASICTHSLSPSAPRAMVVVTASTIPTHQKVLVLAFITLYLAIGQFNCIRQAAYSRPHPQFASHGDVRKSSSSGDGPSEMVDITPFLAELDHCRSLDAFPRPAPLSVEGCNGGVRHFGAPFAYVVSGKDFTEFDIRCARIQALNIQFPDGLRRVSIRPPLLPHAASTSPGKARGWRAGFP